MSKRVFGTALALVLGGVSVFWFQNCSQAQIPGFQESSTVVPEAGPQYSVADVSVISGQTLTVNLALSKIDRDYTINWTILPANSDFNITSGTVNISTGMTVANFNLTSIAPAPGNKLYNLQFVDPSGKLANVYANLTVLDSRIQNSLSVGYVQSCASLNGVAKCWGYNGYGQLGTLDTTLRNAPTAVAVVQTVNMQAISIGTDTSCALVQGAVSCWGYNGYGELGDGSYTNRTSAGVVVGLDSGVTQLNVGAYHACAIQGGALYCWGRNDNGQLGVGDLSNRTAATPVAGMSSGVTAVAAGSSSTCAIQSGAVKCWGYNAYGQLGNGTTIDSALPVSVVGASASATNIAVGDDHACAVDLGRVRCWGYNGNGQLGDGTAISKAAAGLVPSIPSGATQVVTGQNHTCALVSGAVLCWGINNYYNLGNGSTTVSYVPTPVAGLASGVSYIASGAGASHTCAIASQKISCWGRGDYGQIGDGTSVSKGAPTMIAF